MAAAALAAGGIVAGASLAGHSSPAGTSAAAGSAAGPGTQAAALNTALNSANAPGALALTSSARRGGAAGRREPAARPRRGSAGAAAAAHPCLDALKAARAARQAGHPAAARAALRAAGRRCRVLRRRLVRVALRRGIDGQFTFRGQGGAIRTLAFERGVVQSVSGSNVVVRRRRRHHLDLGPGQQHRRPGERDRRPATSALTSGEPVWVGRPGGLRGQGCPARGDPAAVSCPFVQPVPGTLGVRQLTIQQLHVPAGSGTGLASRRPSLREPVAFAGHTRRGPRWTAPDVASPVAPPARPQARRTVPLR